MPTERGYYSASKWVPSPTGKYTKDTSSGRVSSGESSPSTSSQQLETFGSVGSGTSVQHKRDGSTLYFRNGVLVAEEDPSGTRILRINISRDPSGTLKVDSPSTGRGVAYYSTIAQIEQQKRDAKPKPTFEALATGTSLQSPDIRTFGTAGFEDPLAQMSFITPKQTKKDIIILGQNIRGSAESSRIQSLQSIKSSIAMEPKRLPSVISAGKKEPILVKGFFDPKSEDFLDISDFASNVKSLGVNIRKGYFNFSNIPTPNELLISASKRTQDFPTPNELLISSRFSHSKRIINFCFKTNSRFPHSKRIINFCFKTNSRFSCF